MSKTKLSNIEYRKILELILNDIEDGTKFNALQDFPEQHVRSVLVRNRLLGLYYSKYKLKPSFPQLFNRYQLGQSRAFKQMATLLDINKKFVDQGIAYVNLKGPVLSQQIYSDFALRRSGDIDLLIQKNCLKQSIDLLKNMGFQLQNSASNLRQFTDKEVKMISSCGSVNLELHTRLFNNPYLFPVAKVDFTQLDFVKINGVDFPVLPKAINFIYILLHAAAHNFARLIWLKDVITFKNTLSDQDWEDIELISKQAGLSNWIQQVRVLEGGNLLEWHTPYHFQGVKRAQYLLTLSSGIKYRLHEIVLILLSPYRRWRK